MDTCICMAESLRCSLETTTTLLIDYQFSSVAQFCPTLCDLWTAVCQASLSFTIFWSLLKCMLIKLVMSSNHLILCCPLLLLPSIFPSIRVFSKESVLRIRWPKYWSFSFSISPSNEYSGLIAFRTDWFDLFAVQGILKSLLQYHSSKASVLRCSVFFMVQLSHPYISNGKNMPQHKIKSIKFWGKKQLLLGNEKLVSFRYHSQSSLTLWG